MGKIKLDLDAEDNLDFDRPVAIPQPTARKDPLRVTFTFKWRNRRDVAALFDGYIERARALAKAAEERAAARAAAEEAGQPLPDEPGKSMMQLADEGIARDIEVLKDIATAWNIDAPFDDEHLAKFFRKYPGAGSAIANDYRVSLTEGRLGNSGT
jgi:hypothetical protein